VTDHCPLQSSSCRVESAPGLRERDFRKICVNGFGDGHNAYAYSMAWFQDHIYVGTSRANLQLLKLAMPFVHIDVWPVEVSDANYTPRFERVAARGEIWRYGPLAGVWTRVHQSPLVTDRDGVEFSRDLGFRAMVVFKGKSDDAPCLYVTTWSRSRSDGPELLRCANGVDFELMPKPRFQTQGRHITFNAIRALVAFKGRLYTAPTGATRGNVNASGVSLVYFTEDPASGRWMSCNDPGFGSFPEVVTVYELAVLGDHLYAGTGGANGFELWRTTAEGDPPYHWQRMITSGAGRGALNQGAVAMQGFNGSLYIGTGIQNGGYDWRNKIGPAAAEIIRLNADSSWDIIVGNARDRKQPLSEMRAGFNNFFAGYIWRFGVHDGWLYAGTMDWSTILKFTNLKEKPLRISRLLAEAGVDDFVAYNGGFDLWRTFDGENWLSVTHRGFGNPYNFGCRSILSTPYGLFIGTANPFGPKVACRVGTEWNWVYEHNPRGGLEIWLGKKSEKAAG
jgi:hypothetical protein